MKRYEIRQSTKRKWVHEFNLIRGYMRGRPVTAENHAFFGEALNHLHERMILDTLYEVCFRISPRYCKYRNGWSDKRAAEFVNEEFKKLGDLLARDVAMNSGEVTLN
jgi:hypothetical protein